MRWYFYDGTMDEEMKVATSQKEIQRWIQAHHGVPYLIEVPPKGHRDPILCIDFPGDKVDTTLDVGTNKYKLSWKEFFSRLESFDLAFLYSQDSNSIDPSLEYRLIKRSQIQHEKEQQQAST